MFKNFFSFIKKIISYDWATYFGLFIISFVCIAFEVVLNRMFALMFWYHFAFLIVSISLFGIGVGSILVYFFNKSLKNDVPIIIGFLCCTLALLIPFILLKVNTIPLNMDLVGKSEEHDNYFNLIFLILSLPFVIIGFIFSFLFTNYKEDINRIYFFDLAGGGLGAILALFIFEGRGPFISSLILSALLIVAGSLFCIKRNLLLSILIMPTLSLYIYSNYYPQVKEREVRSIRGGKFKFEVDKKTGKYIYTKEFLDTYPEREFAKWDTFGYVTVYNTRNPAEKMIMNNFNCFTRIIGIKENKYPVYQDYFYPYLIKETPDDVCIIGSGGGRDVAMALGVGAKNIYGAEFNKTIHELYAKIYAEYNGNIENLPNVHVDFAEGRFYIRSSNRKYDVILFDNAIGIMAVTSGAFTLSESFLYTVEAMMDYIDHLKQDGILFLSNPVGDMDRFVTILREAFKRMGKETNFKNSIFVTDNSNPDYTRCKVLVKNGAFTEEEIAKLIAFSKNKGDNIHYAPGKVTEGYIANLILTDEIEKIYEESYVELRPSTDDWPFITQRVKPFHNEITLKMKKDIYFFYPEPFLLLKKTTKNVLIYSLLFLLLPLFFLNLKGFNQLKNKFGTVVYFVSLGLGFMFLEIVFMQKYIFILGHPVYAFSYVLAALLISSGFGSLISNKFKNPYFAIFIGISGILVSSAIFFLFFKYFATNVIGLAFIYRALISILLISFNGIFMGFMMPSGIRAISKTEDAIPWMWSVNSVFSVVASFLSVLLSIIYNFTTVLLLGVLVYIIGTIFFVLKRN